MYHRRDTRQGNNQGHHNVGRDPVFERFISMVQNLVPTSEIYPEDEDSDYVPEQEEPPRGPPTIPTSASQSGFQRTTYTTRTFRGGTASFTIFTGASGPQQGHHQRPHATGPNISAPDDPFQTYVSEILRKKAYEMTRLTKILEYSQAFCEILDHRANVKKVLRVLRALRALLALQGPQALRKASPEDCKTF